MESVFENAGRVPRVGWDGFHRRNIAGVRACGKSARMGEFFDLLQTLENQFGFGQGRAIDIEVAEYCGIMYYRSKKPGGTRKWNYMTDVPARFLQKLPSWLRVSHLRAMHLVVKKFFPSRSLLLRVLI